MDVSKKKNPASAENDWLPCKPGLIVGPEANLQTRVAKRKTTLFQLGAIYFCAGLVVWSIGMSLFSAPRGHTPPPLAHSLSCEQCRLLLCDYATKSVHCCQTRAGVTMHLHQCPQCDLCYQQMVEGGFSPSIPMAAGRMAALDANVNEEVITSVATELAETIPSQP